MMLAGVALLVALGASWWGTGQLFRSAPFKIAPGPPGPPGKGRPRPAAATGGGLAIAVVILVALVVAAAAGWVRSAVALALVPAGIALIVIGRQEDRGVGRPGARLAVHTLAAIWVIYCFGPVELFGFPRSTLLGALAALITVVGIVGITNLFRQMDAVDGLAAAEAATVGLIAALLCWRTGDFEPGWIAALIAVSAAGFLPSNWFPARIRIGAAGSVFLGFLLATLCVLTDQRGDIPASAWLVLLGALIVDVVVRQVPRLARRAAPPTTPYQRALKAGRSPAAVSAIVMGLNAGLGLVVWLAIARPDKMRLAYGIAGGVLLLAYWLVGYVPPPKEERRSVR